MRVLKAGKRKRKEEGNHRDGSDANMLQEDLTSCPVAADETNQAQAMKGKDKAAQSAEIGLEEEEEEEEEEEDLNDAENSLNNSLNMHEMQHQQLGSTMPFGWCWSYPLVMPGQYFSQHPIAGPSNTVPSVTYAPELWPTSRDNLPQQNQGAANLTPLSASSNGLYTYEPLHRPHGNEVGALSV